MPAGRVFFAHLSHFAHHPIILSPIILSLSFPSLLSESITERGRQLVSCHCRDRLDRWPRMTDQAVSVGLDLTSFLGNSIKSIPSLSHFNNSLKTRSQSSPPWLTFNWTCSWGWPCPRSPSASDDRSLGCVVSRFLSSSTKNQSKGSHRIIKRAFF